MTGPIIVTLLFVALIVIMIRTYMKRSAALRIAHEARMRAMAQVAISAAKKKAAAEAAAAKKADDISVTATTMREERECPFCAELILKKARVCKHCRRDVEPLG